MKKNKRINEGVFSSADKFISAFFDRLENHSADRFIKKVEKAKLPPMAIKHMKAMQANADALSRIMYEMENGI
jgi:hypothetical protein